MLLRKPRKIYRSAAKTPVKQKQIIAIRIRLRVTTCLYLSPNNSARSLSILMAVDVKIDIPQRIRAVTFCATTTYRCTFGTVVSNKTAKSGCEIRPTLRSVTARHWNNSFVGGWTEDTLRRAIRIKALPRHAVMKEKCSKRLKTDIFLPIRCCIVSPC